MVIFQKLPIIFLLYKYSNFYHTILATHSMIYISIPPNNVQYGKPNRTHRITYPIYQQTKMTGQHLIIN